ATDYLELLNRSAYPQRLSGWKLWIGPTPVLLPTLEVPAGGLIVLTPKPQAFQGLSGCYALQALTLPNAGTTLRLTDAWGVLICRLDYRPEWIDDPFRAEGGWSLEQVDEGRPWDPENNWKVSHAAAGGTPCAPNSRAGIQPDDHAPRLLKVWPVGPSSLRLSFSEPMGAPVREPGRYALTPDSLKILGISDASGAGMELTLSTSPLPGEGIPCSLQTGDGLMDLSGNPLPSTTLCFGQPMESRAGDLVINELLFDPWPGGEDYVEIYHRSDHVLDLQWLRLCSRDPETGEVQQISRICRDTALLCPGEFRVLCPDQEAVAAQYPQACGEAFLDDMADFPSFSDGEGGVLLSRYDGLSIDAFDYDESLHSAFLSDPEGVALERIDPDLPAARADNWQSASLASGYASPGCPNAQPPAQETRESVEVAPPLLSPDGDGRDEVLTISLRPGRAGSLANLRIFTEGGRPCRTLALGALLGEEDHFYWKGENEGGQRVAPGRYLVLVQFFHEDGSTQALRELVWVAY
ncbi:MAG TPA: hypothetical protein P5248_05410, partial [Bacteroidales bacterium]|nr:hypothetical protein [Bacteroidales bacterium]